MQLQSIKRDLEVSGFNNESKSFGIKSSPMMFKILSDKMYSDKISAVIREYGCNAYDAHIAAGTQDKPFEVHLPNHFEPYFYIRDYGTGLSEQEIFEVYTQYGESTKANSNDFIGALGLGSKSAFAYVDQFTVESFLNGEKKTYNGYLGDDGGPMMLKISEEPTDEPNGVKVHMFVQPIDFNTFADRARKIFHRFPVLPIITGNRDAVLTQVKYTLKGPNYKLRDAESEEKYRYGEHSACFAVQGVVAYPIKWSNMTLELTQKQRDMLRNMPLDINFPIGELDIAPSREELSYDKRTQQNIINALESVIQHVPTFAKDILKEAKTEWEAKLLYHKWIGNNSTQAQFMKEMLGNELVWDGRPVKHNKIRVFCYDRQTATGAHLDKFKEDYSDGYQQEQLFKTLEEFKIDRYGDCSFYDAYTIRNQSGRRKSSPVISTELRVLVTPKTKIILVDLEKFDRKVTKYVVHNFAGKDLDVYVFRVAPEHHDKIIEQLGGCPDVMYASELEEPPVEPKDTTVVKRNVQQCYHVENIAPYNYPPLNLNQTNYDVSQGGVYVLMYSKQIVHPGSEFADADSIKTGGEVNNLIKLADRLGLFNDIQNLYAFNSSKANILKKYDNWVNLFDLLKERVINILTNESEMINALITHQILLNNAPLYSKLVEYHEELTAFTYKPNSKLHKLIEATTSISSVVEAAGQKANKDPAFKIAKNLRSGYGYQPDVLKLIQLSEELLNIKTKDMRPKALKFCENFINMQKKFYPLLDDLLGYYSNDENKKSVAHYIKLCDACPSIVTNYNQ